MAAIRTEVTKVGGSLLTGKGVRETSEVLDLFDILIWVWFYKYTHIGKDTEGMYILLYIVINTSKNVFNSLFFFLIFLLYNTVLVLPYIDMNPPQVYMSSQP